MTQERIISSNLTPSELRNSPAAMSDDMLSALTPPLHCASILQPATSPQVVEGWGWGGKKLQGSKRKEQGRRKIDGGEKIERVESGSEKEKERTGGRGRPGRRQSEREGGKSTGGRERRVGGGKAGRQTDVQEGKRRTALTSPPPRSLISQVDTQVIFQSQVRAGKFYCIVSP